MKLSDLVEELNKAMKRHGNLEIVRFASPNGEIQKIEFALICPVPSVKSCTVTLVPESKHDYSKMEG